MKLLYGIGMCAAFAAFGCGKKDEKPVEKVEKPVVEAKVEPGHEHELMPIAKGNEWVYEAETVLTTHEGKTARRKNKITQRVISVSDIPGGKRAKINVFAEDAVIDRQVVDVTPKGLFQVSGGMITAISFSPAQPMLLFPIDKHENFNWKGRGPMLDGTPGTATVENVSLGAQEVDTEMGRMSGYATESKIKFNSEKGQGEALNRAWFAPKIGIIRVVTDVKSNGTLVQQTMQLKSYKVAP